MSALGTRLHRMGQRLQTTAALVTFALMLATAIHALVLSAAEVAGAAEVVLHYAGEATVAALDAVAAL